MGVVPMVLVAHACGAPPSEGCGPERARVARVLDGDTVELEGGQRVRYLLIDAPESGREEECWGEEAREANRRLVEGREIQLRYDVECRDRYHRLLAYVRVDDVDVTRFMVAEGHACFLRVPPNGADRAAEIQRLQSEARAAGHGLWAACDGC